MAKTSTSSGYHDSLMQPYRVQKRMVLDRCFKEIKDNREPANVVNYVTFGGEDIYDAMDLVKVFDVKQYSINVLSYECDLAIANKSRDCDVFKQLNELASVEINVVNDSFYSPTPQFENIRNNGPVIFHLDHCVFFFEEVAKDNLTDLAELGRIRVGDWLMVTSCLTPRTTNHSRRTFLNTKRNLDEFRLHYNLPETPNLEFRLRNFVDLFATKAIRVPALSPRICLEPMLKVRYRDTTHMGLWLFKVAGAGLMRQGLKDSIFVEDYCSLLRSNVRSEATESDEIDVDAIFDDLF